MTPIGMLSVLVVLAGSCCALGALVRRFHREQASSRRWISFISLVVIGLLVGAWCAFQCEYPLGAHYRIGSFPLPIVFFHLEDGQWVDFPVPKFQATLAACTNILAITALATVPLWLLTWRRQSHDHTMAQPG